MDSNTVLSLSSDQTALASREATLRSGGVNVVSVMSPIQARFEIEMGRCGIFLICYRLSQSAADELTHLFRKRCPEGRIIFVMEQPEDGRVPLEANVALLESNGPETILEVVRNQTKNAPSYKPRTAT